MSPVHSIVMTMHEPEPMSSQQVAYEATETREENQPTSKQLLSKVLIETLSRRREDSDGLISHLQRWRSTLSEQVLSQAMLASIVGQVLFYRMGPEAENIPDSLRQEVGDVLWNDPESQIRLNRFWENLKS